MVAFKLVNHLPVCGTPLQMNGLKSSPLNARSSRTARGRCFPACQVPPPTPGHSSASRSTGQSKSIRVTLIDRSGESISLRNASVRATENVDSPASWSPEETEPPQREWSQESSHSPSSFSVEAKRSRRQSERLTYLTAAILSSVGFTALAGGAVFYRFFSQMQSGGQMPYLEMFGTFSLAIGAAVGMEFWARWAHRALWHDSLWHMHESHHRPRDGPFELNDVFAIINAFPAILLLAYGFFNKGVFPGMCFGAGLGITLFGMAYMFVHDGLVHRRFPVGPVANIPYLQKVAAAHQLHHADKYEGVPFGLFLGVQELEEVGGLEDLESTLKIRQAQLSRN